MAVTAIRQYQMVHQLKKKGIPTDYAEEAVQHFFEVIKEVCDKGEHPRIHFYGDQTMEIVTRKDKQ